MFEKWSRRDPIASKYRLPRRRAVAPLLCVPIGPFAWPQIRNNRFLAIRRCPRNGIAGSDEPRCWHSRRDRHAVFLNISSLVRLPSAPTRCGCQQSGRRADAIQSCSPVRTAKLPATSSKREPRTLWRLRASRLAVATPVRSTVPTKNRFLAYCYATQQDDERLIGEWPHYCGRQKVAAGGRSRTGNTGGPGPRSLVGAGSRHKWPFRSHNHIR